MADNITVIEGMDQFDKHVIKGKGVVLVDFYADWCMPCKTIGPMLESMAQDDTFTLVKINVDNPLNLKAVQYFNIRSIPAMIIFKDGNLIEVMIGMQSKDTIEKIINDKC